MTSQALPLPRQQRATRVEPDELVSARLEATPDLLGLSCDPGLRLPAVITVAGWRLLVADPVERLTTLAQLDEFAQHVGWRNPPPAGPPFATAAVGYIGSEAGPHLLRLEPDARPDIAPLAPLHFGVYEWAVAVAPDGGGWVVGTRERVAELRRWIETRIPTAVEDEVSGRRATTGMSRAAHAGAVEQILDWIAAGDLYQANLTFQVATPWAASPQELARRLGEATPDAAHAALLVLDGAAVVSASPETFLRIAGDAIVTRPIKGTRPRHGDPVLDRAAGAALLDSAKDAAEHVMIVDLERNDLGRVCEPGSVVVPEYAALEGHPTVWHLTSTVRGRLRDDALLSDVVTATFPPGSVTGTPKRMAVSRTALLEPVRRGVYCGAIGMISRGVVDLSVAIRTAVVHDGIASYGTGGGIVADSQPDAEYEEALAKAAAFLRATDSHISH